MKYKIAICKITMIGEKALILGLCHYDEDDEFWEKVQFFTFENFPLPTNPESQLKRADYDEGAEWGIKPLKLEKYQHPCSIHFDSINKDVEIHHCVHAFNLGEAKPVELTKEEFYTLKKELRDDGWMDFDWETWGK